jgi:hypothetical protein
MTQVRTPERQIAQNPPSQQSAAAITAVAAIGLITVGVIHALEIQDALTGPVWLTIGFCALTIAGPLSALWLLIRPGREAWLAAGLICLSAFLGYVVTRSVATPGDAGDVGNWLEPLGLAALIVEGLVVILAGLALRDLLGADPAQ